MILKDRPAGIVDPSSPFNYRIMRSNIDALCGKYPYLRRKSIGRSYLARDIDVISFGEGSKKTLYIGTHHGMEWITSLILMKFLQTLCEHYQSSSKLANYDMDYIYSTRTIHIIPMLNPDGAELAINGIQSASVIKQRLLCLNDGSDDFTHWQANARGIDLNHNYDAGFPLCKLDERTAGITYPCSTRFGGDYPESEPETAALCSYIRGEGDISRLYALHTQGEVIYWTYGDTIPPASRQIASLLSRSSGYALDVPEGTASHGGCKDWFISAYNLPGFTIECGSGTNPLPQEQAYAIYARLEEALLLGSVM